MSNSKYDGYIKLHRAMLNWEWYDDINVKVLFLHCLLRVNHEDNKYSGILIKKGSFMTSYEKLSIETGLTYKQVRVALSKLKRTGEVAHEGQSQYSIITVNNWDKYQIEGQAEGQTEGRRRATNKKDKNNIINNNIREQNFIKPTIDEIKNYCIERNNSINAQSFYDYYESIGWKRGKTKMKDWKAAIRTWEQNERKNYNKNSDKPNKENGWEL